MDVQLPCEQVGLLSDGILGSVVNPRHFVVDPNLDPAFHFDAYLADPDPTFHSDAELDANPDPTTGTHFFLDLDPSMLQNDPIRLTPFHFDTDPDPAFQFDTDRDLDPAFHFDANLEPDPASQNDADPCGFGSARMWISNNGFRKGAYT